MRSDASRNHEAILTGAIAVLATEPQASMQEIAEASGTGRTTLYRHFPDRDALVAAIHERVHAEADDAIAATLARADGADPVLTLADLAAELSGFGDRYRFLERRWAAAPDATDRATNARPALHGYVVAAQRRGAVRDDLSADWLLDALGAIVTRAAIRAHDAPEARAEMVRRTMRSLLAPAP